MKPCGDCPFRKDSVPGWIGTFEGVEELAAIARSESPFSCHKKTDDRTNMLDTNAPQCVGRLLFASKCAKKFRAPGLERLREQAVSDNPEYKDEVFGRFDIEEHHKHSILEGKCT